MNVLTELKNLISKAEAKEVKLESMNGVNGAIFESETWEMGDSVFLVTEEGNIPVPPGNYELENGFMLVVQEEGVIAQYGQAQEEPEEEQEMEKEPEIKKVVETVTTHFDEDKKEETVEVFFNDQAKAELKTLWDQWYAGLSEQEAEKVDEVIEEKEELSKAIKHSPEKNVKQVALFKIGENRKETLQDRINKTLFSN